MANKNIDVRLTFHSDTSKAKANLKDLTNDILNIKQKALSSDNFGLNTELQEAVKTCNVLEQALYKATSSTGNLDLYDFRKELEKAGLDAKKISQVLDALGPEGQAAFNKIAHAVANAEMPLKRTNKLLEEFKTTLKNTIRWQISSTAINALSSGMQQAYNYAKDLNSSLNDIRIVTGKSADEMADFAKEANKSAKQLSATTLAYTDASLIYFQQGLDPAAVKERTDVTIKMSNVTKDSVEETSSAMTAVWNNFADGTKELEYYGDVITKLGAKTAASSSEITTGLSKFASIGKTVGLSFEYATAALATIIDKTRQSEDVVGTALKTIFSRIQSLSLGETLEDGVTLTKYSKGLQSVGVEVLNADGSLKKLDETLEDVGAKWETLSAAEKTALAQTVAGTRQYAQFIALMDNWDDVQENVLAAKNSTGTLQAQADIYAESWEAARKRVQTSLQKIYTQIIEDKTFIKLTDNVSKFVDAIGNVIDGLGGIKGILLTILPLMTQVFRKDIAKGMGTFASNFDRKQRETKNKNRDFVDSFYAVNEVHTPQGKVGEYVKAIGDKIDYYDAAGIEIPQETIDKINYAKAQASFLADSADRMQAKEIQASLSGEGLFGQDNKRDIKAEKLYQFKMAQTSIQKATSEDYQFDKELYHQKLKEIFKDSDTDVSILLVEDTIKSTEDLMKALQKKIEEATKDIENSDDLEVAKKERDKQIKEINSNKKLKPKNKKTLIQAAEKEYENKKAARLKDIEDKANDNSDKILKEASRRGVEGQIDETYKGAIKELDKAEVKAQAFTDRIVDLTTKTVALGNAFHNLGSLVDIAFDDSMDGAEKAEAIIGNLTSSVMGLATAFPKFSEKAFGALNKKLNLEGFAKQLLGVGAAAEGAGGAMTTGAGGAAALGGALSATSLVLIGIVVAIGVAIVAIKALDKQFEKAVETSKKHLEETTVQTEKLKEQEAALDSLTKKYEEYNNSLNEEQLHDLRMETYDLCLQYGEQDLAIQALTASYKELKTVMDSLEDVNQTGLQKAYTEQAQAGQNALDALARQKDWENTKDTLFGFGNVFHNAFESINANAQGLGNNRMEVAGDKQSEVFLRQLQTLGVGTTDQGIVDVDALFKAATGENSDELYRMISSSSSDAAQEISKFLSENAEVLEATRAANQELVNLKIKEAFQDFNKENATVVEYRAILEQLAADTNSTIEDIENKAIHTIDNIGEYAVKNNLLSKLLEEGWEQDVAERFVNSLTDAEVDYYSKSAAGRSRSKGGKIDAVDQKILNAYDSAYNRAKISNLLSTDTEGQSFSKSMVEDIFKDKTFGQYTDSTGAVQRFAGTANAADFERLSLGRQQTIAISHLLNNPVDESVLNQLRSDQVIASKEQAKLSEQLEGKNTESYDKFFKETLSNPAKVEESFGNYDLSAEAINLLKNPDKLKEFFLKDIKEMNTEEAGVFYELEEALAHYDGTNLSEIQEITQLQKKYDDATKKVNDYEVAISKVEVTSEEVRKVMKITNEELDNLQSAYQTMASAQDEYNEQGYLSVDTLQSVLALGPEYTSLLLDERGNLNLNREALNELTKARLSDLALQETQLAITLLREKHGEDADKREAAAQQIAAATQIEADANWDLVDSNLAILETWAAMDKENAAYVEAIKARVNAIRNASDNYTGEFGSSGKGSSSKKENKEYADEFDRYYEINENLQEISHSMDLVAEQQQHLFGNELARSLRETNGLLEEQREQLKALREEQLKEAGELQASLGKSGLQFDKQSGKIINYAAVTAEALKRYNDAVTAYNASAKDAAAEQVFQAEEERFNQFKEEISRYDALVAELQQNERDLQSNYFAQLGNELNAWKAEVQVQLDFANADKAWAEFIGKISQNFKDVFADVSAELSSIADQMNASLSAYSINNSAANTVMGEIDKMMNGGSSNMFASVSEAQEHLKGYREALIAEASSMYDLYRSAWDGYLEGIDQALQKFEDLNKEYEDINTMLEHQGQLIKLLYGEDAFDLKGKQISTQVDASISKMQSLREQQAFYEEMYNQEVQRNGADSVSAKKWKDAWSQAIMELQSEEVNFIELVQKEATNSIENIFNLLEKKIGNGKTLAQISEQWDDIKAATEGYYDAVERVTEINEMENKWQKAISNTSGLKNQQRLKTLMDEQLDSLKDKNKLSEYDITLAEKRLAVYQAQIALEEAQNNKNAMKLTRGTDGNWSYQYVADVEDIAKKEEDLAKANGDYYGYVKDSWLGMTESINTTTQTALQRISELEQQALTADTDKQAEIAAQIEYLKEYYWGESGVLTLAIAQQAQMEQDLNQATAETLWGLYQTNADNYTIMTDTQKELIDSFKEHGITSYETLDEAIRTSYDDIINKGKEVNEESLEEWTSYAAEMCRLWNSTDADSIKQNVTQALDSCTTVLNKYFLRVEQGSIAAGEDITNVANKVDMLSERVENLTDVTEDLARDSANAMDDYWEKLQDIEEQWNAIEDAIRRANERINEYLRLQGLERQKMNETYVPSGPITDITGGVVPGPSNNGGGYPTNNTTRKFHLNQQGYEDILKKYKGEELERILALYDLSNVKTTKGPFQSGGSNQVIDDTKPTKDEYIQTATLGEYTSYEALNTAVADLFRKIEKMGALASSSDKTRYARLKTILHDAAALNTGGYTGAWGSSGKLAVLHEKELVLNKEDTANVLTAVDIARSMTTLLNSISNSMLSGMSSGGAPVDKTSSQQVINVTAEFPNATEVESIREALLSLPTLASQYTS